jgi:hypothetical protein
MSPAASGRRAACVGAGATGEEATAALVCVGLEAGGVVGPTVGWVSDVTG